MKTSSSSLKTILMLIKMMIQKKAKMFQIL